jgi:hypothetical protein
MQQTWISIGQKSINNEKLLSENKILLIINALFYKRFGWIEPSKTIIR